jgi:hypothetical protein
MALASRVKRRTVEDRFENGHGDSIAVTVLACEGMCTGM